MCGRSSINPSLMRYCCVNDMSQTTTTKNHWSRGAFLSSLKSVGEGPCCTLLLWSSLLISKNRNSAMDLLHFLLRREVFAVSKPSTYHLFDSEKQTCSPDGMSQCTEVSIHPYFLLRNQADSRIINKWYLFCNQPALRMQPCPPEEEWWHTSANS